jgi:hypothetical protein
VVYVREANVLGVAVWCVFTTGKDEEGGAGGVEGGGVGTIDDVFHSPGHAFVVVVWNSDVGTVPCVGGVSSAG